MQKYIAALAGLIAATAIGPANATTIAYDNAAVGQNQDYGGSLGLDFTVNAPISITALGAFDSGVIASLDGRDGRSGVTVAIFDTSTGLQVGSAVTFTSVNSGTAVNGDAFLSVSPFTLTAGTYSIVAANDINYNSQGGPNATSTEDTGGGLISFVAGGRYTADQGAALAFPTVIDAGPTNRYDAGTFQFTAVPEPASLLLLGAGLLGIRSARRKRS